MTGGYLLWILAPSKKWVLTENKGGTMRGFVRILLPVIIGMLLVSPLPSSGETVRSGLERTLEQAGVENTDSVVRGVQGLLGSSLDAPFHDSVDFAAFPTARLDLNKLSAPAVLVLPPSTVNFVFRGKPDSFQGSFRSYEFHLGKGIQKASHMIYPQVFQRIRAVGSMAQVGEGEIAVVPELSEFKFRWGGSFTPVIYVSLKMKVTLFADGNQVFQKTYEEKKVKEGAGSLFPHEDQEHKAISRALINALKQSAGDISASPILLAFGKSKLVKPPAVGHEKIDMDAILFLAGTWQQYAKNKGRLTLLEKQVATRFLRLQDAWEKKDTVRQQEQVSALINHAKTLEPVSRAELLEELKYQKGYTDRQIEAENAAENRIFNFAGNQTDTVLDYAGLGIDVAKVGVLATGCVISSGATCLALSTTMAQWDMAGTIAEGIGAASEELIYKSGDVSTALFAGAKSSLIDYGAGKIGGKLAEATAGKLGTKVAKTMAKSAATAGDTVVSLAGRVQNDVFVRAMEIVQRPLESGASSIFKDGTKRVEAKFEDEAKRMGAKLEDMIFKDKGKIKALKNSAPTLETRPAHVFDSLSEL